MANYKFEINYDGTRYYGWEHQPNVDTIQGRIEAVLARMVGTPVELIGAGRTDGGVHAKGMVANAHMKTTLTETEIRDYLNKYLPEDICIRDVRVCSDRFHARYNAVGKLYTYTCYVGDTKPVFNRKFVTVLESVPNVQKMREAAEFLMGSHDFKSFCSNRNMTKTTVRVVDKIEINLKKDYLYLSFHGTGFLRNMVRIMVGTLLEAGYGRLDATAMPTILEALNREAAGPMAPAEGLCLMEVDY